MPFGSFLGKRECMGLIKKHSVVKKKSLSRKMMVSFGSLFIKIFGYPEIGIRRRAPYIIKELELKKGDKILDAGCGPGILALHLAKNYDVKVQGIDVDKEDVELAKQFKKSLGIKNVNFSIQNITNLKSPRNSFDKIICSEVLEHVSNDKKAVKELTRVLKPNGKIIFTIPYTKKGKAGYGCKKGHEREGYSFKEVRKLIESQGLTVKKAETIYKFFSVLGERIEESTFKFVMFPFSFLIAQLDFLVIRGNNLLLVAEK